MLERVSSPAEALSVAEGILEFAAVVERELNAGTPASFQDWKTYQRSVLGLSSFEWPVGKAVGPKKDSLAYYFGMQSGFALVCHGLVVQRLGGSISARIAASAEPAGGKIELSAAHRFFQDSWMFDEAASDTLLHRTGDFRSRTFQDACQAALLSSVYQAMFPPTVRRRLGEFHTPEALARHLVDETGYFEQDGFPTLCDPSCGCGIFLETAIRERVKRTGVSLADVLQSVVGLELNPASLIGAWCAYSLAVSPLV